MTIALLGHKRHEQMMLEALSLHNRADFEAHYPNKKPSIDELVRFYWEHNGGAEAFGEN